MYPIAGVGGYYVAAVLKKMSLQRAADRDAVLYDYIINHPEDFPILGQLFGLSDITYLFLLYKRFS